jgi:Na+/proline symporter
MAAIGVILALYYSGLVFTLVVFAVAGLTACFGPPVLMSVVFKRLNRISLIASMLLAPLAAVIWTLATKPGLLNSVAATPIGFAAGIIILCVGRLIDG